MTQTRHIQLIMIAALAGLLAYFLLSGDAFALLQLDDSLKPEGINSIDLPERTDEDTAETYATRTIALFVGSIVSRVLLFAGSVAVLSLIMSGILYIRAFGKDESIEKGKRGMTWSLIGLVVILMSYAIVQGIIRILVGLDG